MSHLLAEGHVASAVGAFAFAMFAICWAWMNFTWFASAYDTDDWFFRAATMVQMIGVLVLALGMPNLFHSIDQGHAIDNRTLVAGYVVMRIAMVALWLRAAAQDPSRRSVALRYAVIITISQVGWVIAALLHLDLLPTIAIVLVLFSFELISPVLAEGDGSTPWHAHHIAERYGLLTIIALGEGVFGTVTTVSAVVEEHGWSREAITLVVAGIGLTFGLWWNYFLIPSANILAQHRSRAIVWAYGHMPLFASVAATGAGLHVAAYVIDGEATISAGGAVLAVAVPVFVFLFALYAIYSNLLREFDPFHLALFATSIAIEAAAVMLAFTGAPLALCLFLVPLSPFVTIVGYETIGHRHAAAALARA
jgi:low temperature requirement protein LtrA